MKRFYFICAGVTAILLGITYFFQNEPTNFYGIADTKETIINAVEGVEIKSLMVVQGQTVNPGDTLVVLEQPELKIRINEISHTLNEYKAQLNLQNNFSRSEMRKYEAERDERMNEIIAEIRELEAQYELNKKLVKELRSFQGDRLANEGDDSTNPILTQIKSLKLLLESAKTPAEVEIQRIQKQLMSSSQDPISPQVNRLTEELALLEKEQGKLVICAHINGMIGSVKFKEGEKVSPFDTILTLHAAAPSYIKGFIHENVYSLVSVGDNATVKSLSDKGYSIVGKVVGVGSRIVDYPERLRTRIDIPIWGREILIKIPEENRFLLGEKVVITIPKKKIASQAGIISTNILPEVNASPFSDNVSDTPATMSSDDSLYPIHFSENVPGQSLEASGLCYLEDIKSFLVISDDTEKKQPFLFFMNGDGIIYRKELIADLPEINDMEAITSDTRGSYYIISSQSYNKKGRQPLNRQLFIRLKRTGDYSFVLDKKVTLFDLLKKCAARNENAEWAKFINIATSEKSGDIEGICFTGDTLLLGFKNPKILNNAVILGITNTDELFQNAVIVPENVFIWRQLTIRDTLTGAYCGIADLTFKNDTLYGVSTGATIVNGTDRDIGIFWKYGLQGPTPETLLIYRDKKPEGLSYNKSIDAFGIVFDNGSNAPSQLSVVKGY